MNGLEKKLKSAYESKKTNTIMKNLEELMKQFQEELRSKKRHQEVANG